MLGHFPPFMSIVGVYWINLGFVVDSSSALLEKTADILIVLIYQRRSDTGFPVSLCTKQRSLQSEFGYGELCWMEDKDPELCVGTVLVPFSTFSIYDILYSLH